MFIAILIAIVIIAIFIFKPRIPKIYECDSIYDIVMSVNHGRIYPYYTGMSYKKAKQITRNVHPDATGFDQMMDMYEIIGTAPYLDLPVSSRYIERISVMVNNDGIVSSVSMHLSDPNAHMEMLVKCMVSKFGRPLSIDGEFIIWREGKREISIHNQGSLSVIDDRFFGR